MAVVARAVFLIVLAVAGISVAEADATGEREAVGLALVDPMRTSVSYHFGIRSMLDFISIRHRSTILGR